MAYTNNVSRFALIISFLLLLSYGNAQFVSKVIGDYEVSYFIGKGKGKFIKAFPQYNSPGTLDKYYSYFDSSVLEVVDSEDSLCIVIVHSQKPINTILRQYPFSDTNLCICKSYPEFFFEENGSTYFYGLGYYPLSDVSAYLCEKKRRCYQKICRIEPVYENCTEKFCFSNRNNCYLLLFFHKNFELINVVEVKKVE